MGNLERVQKFENAYQASGWRDGPNLITGSSPPQTVNASYVPWRNEIILPAAMLQPPLFDPDADDAVNYGALGAVVGHEIGHAFDQRGRRYDGYGARLRLVDTCRRREFRSARSARSNSSTVTAGDSNQRVERRTHARREHRRPCRPCRRGSRLPPLTPEARPRRSIDGFTGEQRLFVRWAQLWRTLTRDEYLRQTLLTQPACAARAPRQRRRRQPRRLSCRVRRPARR